jgi:hypothetical protein
VKTNAYFKVIVCELIPPKAGIRLSNHASLGYGARSRSYEGASPRLAADLGDRHYNQYWNMRVTLEELELKSVS